MSATQKQLPSFTPGPWAVDECPDAAGFLTVRRADGMPNGDTDAQPIATVYDSADARLIAAAPGLGIALAALLATARVADACNRTLDSHTGIAPELFAQAEAALAAVEG